jgi:glucose-6-phosphate isomerase
MAYLDSERDADLASIRPVLAKQTGRPVTFGWGPRFLHSTGQYHKGGHPEGVFLQITAAAPTDVEIPDRPFTFGTLIAAQAAGDANVLAERGRPVLRLHLTDPASGVRQLLSLFDN